MKNLHLYSLICSKSLKKQKYPASLFNSRNTVTGVWKLQPRRSLPHGSSHTCIPPPPSLASPGLWLLHSEGAQPQCEPWMGRSGSKGPGGGGPPCQYPALQTPLRMGQTGSCTGQNTVCCALSLCRIRLLSHAVGMTERGEIGAKHHSNIVSINLPLRVEKSTLCVNLRPSQLILHQSLNELYEWTHISFIATERITSLMLLFMRYTDIYFGRESI